SEQVACWTRAECAASKIGDDTSASTSRKVAPLRRRSRRGCGIEDPRQGWPIAHTTGLDMRLSRPIQTGTTSTSGHIGDGSPRLERQGETGRQYPSLSVVDAVEIRAGRDRSPRAAHRIAEAVRLHS